MQATPTLDQATTQVLAFLLGGERFGLPIEPVREVLQVGRINRVPLMPPALRGLINLRGTVVPVVDLAVRLGRAPAELGRRSCILITEAGAAGLTGLLVDAVESVHALEPGAIEPAPEFGLRLPPDCVSGLARPQGRLMVLLALAPLVNDLVGAAA